MVKYELSREDCIQIDIVIGINISKEKLILKVQYKDVLHIFEKIIIICLYPYMTESMKHMFIQIIMHT